MSTNDELDAYTVEDDFLSIGRTFEEYRRLFDLTPAELVDARVLDCAAGPSSFTAVASSLGADATALDPFYGASVETLAAQCGEALERTEAQLTDLKEQFVWDVYGNVPTRIRYLRAAAERFLVDIAGHPSRYVDGALPDLSFDDGAFDLALSANCCFLYDDRLDRAFHEAALRELARVASEVRVFPLVALDGERSPFVEPVVDALRADGYGVSVCPVPYEFLPGATEMLVVE